MAIRPESPAREILSEGEDEQTQAEVFDEEAHAGPRAQREPDVEAGAGPGPAPLDAALTGARPERFGETPPAAGEKDEAGEPETADTSSKAALRRRDIAADEGAELPVSNPKREESKRSAEEENPSDGPDTSKDEEDPVDRDVEDTFPASDPPSWSPGQIKAKR